MSKRKAASPVAPVAKMSSDYSTCQDYLDQAEVCREQARLAASLKRFKAARGLFSTSIALCKQAITLGGEACSDAKERLRQLNEEMSVYTELAKSMERPISMRPQVSATHALVGRTLPPER